MCYRVATPTIKDMTEFIKRQPQFTIDDYMPYYHANGFSHPPLPIIAADDREHITQAVWGLIPPYARSEADIKKNMSFTLNAKSETLYTAGPYKKAAESGNRCLIIVNGFYEFRWSDLNDKKCDKIPHFIYMPDSKPFTLAGIYSERDGTKNVSIITAEAQGFMRDIHNSAQRMPLVMVEDNWDIWLNREADRPSIEALMHPFPLDGFQYHQIDNSFFKKGAEANVKEIQQPV